MLGDGRPAHGQFPCQIDDGARMLDGAFDIGQPSRIPQGKQSCILVSHDSPSLLTIWAGAIPHPAPWLSDLGERIRLAIGTGWRRVEPRQSMCPL